jgi:transposase
MIDGMANGFLAVERRQQFLLPPDMGEWLPPGHLVWFVVALVESLDLSELEAAYRLGGVGRAAHDPAMMLALRIYASSQGVESSRRIERACQEDVAYRVICAGQLPDHATIARFRKRHEAAIKSLFCQVLRVCAEAGLVRLGVVAVDGTKMQANASLAANRGRDAIEAEVDAILERARAADEAEDAAFGSARGDELPEDLVDPARRLARLREAQARIEQSEESGEETRAQPPRVNVTDPDSRIMKTPGGFCQGYNAQFVVGEGQIVLAAEATNAANDAGLLAPMLETAAANLEAAGVCASPQVVLADAGYWCEDLAVAVASDEPPDGDGPELLVATTKRANQPTEPPPDPAAAHTAELAAIGAERAAEQHRRGAVFARVAAGELTLRAAGDELGLSPEPAHRGYHAWRRGGPDAIPVRRRRRTRAPSLATRARRAMDTKLAEPAQRALYKLRGPLVEGPFGQLKHNRGIRWFSRRGLSAVDSEWKFHGLVHNVLKLHTALVAMPA